MSVGWGIFGFGNLLRFAAMRFAAQMVLSGLGSLQFVMIPIVSNFLLGDKYTWEAFISIVLILGGEQPLPPYWAASRHSLPCRPVWYCWYHKEPGIQSNQESIPTSAIISSHGLHGSMHVISRCTFKVERRCS